MNFKRKDGTRHSSDEMIAAQRRFRHHVRTPRNSRGRIHREECVFCVQFKEDQKTISEAHHLDYKEWWRVTWLCFSHHRKVDHGSLKVRIRHIWDYSSLLIRRTGRPTGKKSTAEAPF